MSTVAQSTKATQARRVRALPPEDAERLPPLDLQLLADLPNLALRARYIMDGFLGGKHRSLQKGSSVEFAEYRQYQFGDDPRRVDWKLFARTDRLQVKRYEEETQLRVFLVLDTSASMHFRSPNALFTKIEYARFTLAALALLAQRQGDGFGLALAGSELNDFLPARRSAAHWAGFVGRLESVVTGGSCALAECLESITEIVPARSVIVVASDFYEENERLAQAVGRLRHDHHDVLGLHVLDPMEVDFGGEENGFFVDLETGDRVALYAPAVRAGYLERFNAFCADLDDRMRGHGGEILRMRTDVPPARALSEYLALREQRL